MKTLEDLAGLVPDDIRGYYESKDGERVREPGILDDYNLSPEDAEALIMRARVAAGWIEPEALVEEELVEEELAEEDEALGESEAAAEAVLEEREGDA